MVDLGLFVLYGGSTLLMFYIGVRAIRTGTHTERGSPYTGKDAKRIGMYYILAGVVGVAIIIAEIVRGP